MLTPASRLSPKRPVSIIKELIRDCLPHRWTVHTVDKYALSWCGRKCRTEDQHRPGYRQTRMVFILCKEPIGLDSSDLCLSENVYLLLIHFWGTFSFASPALVPATSIGLSLSFCTYCIQVGAVCCSCSSSCIFHVGGTVLHIHMAHLSPLGRNFLLSLWYDVQCQAIPHPCTFLLALLARVYSNNPLIQCMCLAPSVCNTGCPDALYFIHHLQFPPQCDLIVDRYFKDIWKLLQAEVVSPFS